MSEAKRSLDPAAVHHEPADELDADGKRGRRRSKTMSRKEIARELRRQRAFGVIDPELEETMREIEARRPRSRADCASGPRPCMFISCKHHLYLDVNPATGSIKLNFPDREVWELADTCALDVADRGGITLEEVGAIMNLTRERIRAARPHRGARRRDRRGPGADGGPRPQRGAVPLVPGADVGR